ncbi:class I SAM-dependent methyltransferase [Streptomyces sp. NPDC001985]|uniref:class I SAM-dependent methyltransferase n=1 Tax=Streptomyces sp. NPDC001985 TaxID=3154406 RepID=UPI0033308309
MSVTEEGTVYGRPEFQNIDVSAQMRDGHVDVRDGDDVIVGLVAARAASLGRNLDIIDVGTGSGFLCDLLADRLPHSRIVANEIEPVMVEQARGRLKDRPNVEIFDKPFSEWSDAVDVIISWGTHHHMPHSYLEQSGALLREGGVLILGDEFAPEYCDERDAARIAAAPVVELRDGYVLTSAEDIAAHERSGALPEWSLALEDRRRRALWHWYKFVIDCAIKGSYWTIALAEMQIAMDDITTSFEEEHKISPLIVERELQLNGFTTLSKNVVGQRDASLQSFFVYEFAPAARQS